MLFKWGWVLILLPMSILAIIASETQYVAMKNILNQKNESIVSDNHQFEF